MQSNLSAPKTSLPPMRRPLLLTEEYITTHQLNRFKKRFPKYIGTLGLNKVDMKGSDRPYLSYIRRAKTVNSLVLRQNIFRPKCRRLNENISLIKSLQKSLRSISGDRLGDKKYHRYFSGLSTVVLDLALPESYQMMSFHRRIKKISLKMSAPYVSIYVSKTIPIAQQLMKKNKRRFNQFLSRSQHASSIEISSNGEELGPIIKLFELLEESPLLIPNLKAFIVKINCDARYLYPEKTSLTELGSFPCLSHITSFSLENYYVEMPMFDLKILKNLQELNLEIKSLMNDSFEANSLYQILDLKDFKNLRSLKLNYGARSKEIERSFFEVLTLPPALRSVELTLQGFKWKKCEPTKKNRKRIIDSIQHHERYSHFYSQWKELKNLKNLVIQIKDYSNRAVGCSEIAGVMGASIIKNIKGLESLHFVHHNFENQGGALELKELFEALKGSRNTIKTLDIFAQKINFVEDIGMDLVKLENFTLGGESVLVSPNTVHFIRTLGLKNKHSTKVIWHNLVIHNIKTFESLLRSLVNLPKSMEVNLNLDIGSLEKENWGENLCQVMKEKRFEGKISLTLTNSFITKISILEEIKALVLANSRFEEILIASRFDIRTRREKRKMAYLHLYQGDVRSDINPTVIQQCQKIQ